MQKYWSPSKYAEYLGVHRLTIIRRFHAGVLPGYKDEYSGKIFLESPVYKEENETPENKGKAILYARVSSQNNKGSLDGQLERMRAYASAKGYTIVGEYKEIASGLNDNRKILNKILDKDTNEYEVLIAEYSDRLTRFGFNYIDRILKAKKQRLEIINQIEEKDVEILDDFISVITSFCMRIYGSRRGKKQTEKIIETIVVENEFEKEN